MNIKKLFATLAGVSLFAQTVVPSVGFAATYSAELEGAYDWAYSKGVTTMSSIDNANMYGAITRAEMAKMLSVYAEKVLGLTANEAAACNFTDIDSVKWDLHDFIVKSCQLGIMGQGITSFRPYDTISRAEFGTALSRVLWGNKYEGGTPYYANHLNALKAAGIMNQIANAESTKEVRGYVMLMLQRSDEGGAGTGSDVDCNDEVVVLACQLGTDACPAACREDANEKEDDEVVKSGSLVVTADGSNGNLFIGRASELDSLTFKTSEEVTISRIVLDRQGYSTTADVATVWLEDANGAKIADPKTVDSKGQVKLTLKKDYKVVDGELDAVIVVETANTMAPGATLGFKVASVDSTAEDVELPSKAYNYTAIKYDGSAISFTAKVSATPKSYNFVAGDMYEVAKFKVQTPDDSSILLRGFTLVESTAGYLDLKKYFDKAEVTVAGEAVKGIEANVNKNGELVVSFKDVEIAAKTKAEIIVKASFGEDFDTFAWTAGTAELVVTDFVAVDGKVESRVSDQGTLPLTLQAYKFAGSKVKFVNNKLGNVDAAQNSEDIIVAEGTVEIAETIKGSAVVNAYGTWAWAIKQLTLYVNGDEYDANPTFVSYNLTPATPGTAVTAAPGAFSASATYTAGSLVSYSGAVFQTTAGVAAAWAWNDADWDPVYTTYSFTFTGVEIEKAGKVRYLVDTKDTSIFDTKSVSFVNPIWTLTYDESNNPVNANEVSGNISFSKVTIQPAKASLSNKLSKDVEFNTNATDRKVVFEGTYTAKKGDIKLNEFSVTGAYVGTTNKITFYVLVDGKEVADDKYDPATTTASNTFDNILVKAGESVTVSVEAEVEAYTAETIDKFSFAIRGEDVNGNNPSGKWDAKTTKLKVVEKGSVSVSTLNTKQTIIRKASDAKIAEFTIKPANGASETTLEEIKFTLTGDIAASDDITLKVDNIEEDDVVRVDTTGPNTSTFTYSMNRTIDADGVTVLVTLDDEKDGSITLNALEVNEKKQSKTFTKRFVEAAVEVVNQRVSNGSTLFKLSVDKDSDVDVKDFSIYYLTGTTPVITLIKTLNNVEDGKEIAADNVKDVTKTLTNVQYWWSDGTVATTQPACADTTDYTQASPCKDTNGIVWNVVRLDNVTLEDYFKIGEDPLKVMNL